MNIQLRDKNFNLGNFGIEIEMWNVTKGYLAAKLNEAGIDARVWRYGHEYQGFWKIVDDASIRRADSCELVSPILNGAEGLELVRKVCAVLDQVGAKVAVTCGLHVHHEAVGFGRESLKKAVTVYKRIEKRVDEFMPASRRGNGNNMIRSTLFAPDEMFESNNSGYRYFKVNCQSFFRHGTIEFRHHSGTTDATKIINWILFTAVVMEKARGPVSSSKELKRWVDLKWYLGLTTDRLSDEVKGMVEYYTRRRREMAATAAAAVR